MKLERTGGDDNIPGNDEPPGWSWLDVCGTSDIEPDDVMQVTTEPPIAVVNADGEFYAIQDECTHESFPLSDGFVCGREIECGYHGTRYDLATGEPLGILANGPVRTFQTKVAGDRILVLLPT